MNANTDNLRANRRRKGEAFTLIELLTIIMIIVLLVGLGAPSILKMQSQAARSVSLTTLRTIDQAVRAYEVDHKQFPPSADSGGLQGKHWLVWALVGYKGEADDKADGYGFRVQKPGTVYGPYVEVAKMRISKTTPPAFLDAFDNEILYYRYDSSPGQNKYQDADNTGTAPQDRPSNINDYAKNGSAYFTTSFLLISRGADGKFESYNSKPATDDCTNFLPE